MALIRENSFNIHPVGNRLVFKEEENAEGKLLANAKNDKLFENGQDIEQLAAEIRYVIGGSEEISRQFRVIVLRKEWQSDPWGELPETERPDRWDSRLNLIVLPDYPDNLDAALGPWLKQHLPQRRNILRFLLPKKTAGNIYFDRELIVYARAVFLANQWKETDPAFKPLFATYQGSHLRPRPGREQCLARKIHRRAPGTRHWCQALHPLARRSRRQGKSPAPLRRRQARHQPARPRTPPSPARRI